MSERAAELMREANKLQGELLMLVDNAVALSPLVKPILRAIVGRLHYLHVSIIEELEKQ